jgi:predicted phage terminase large subunit-like protein
MTQRAIRPQPGPQEAFLRTPADIAIYGGAAGGGKTFSLLMKPLAYANVKGFGAVIFRRTYVQVMDEGGPWDTATQLYGPLGARMNMSDMAFKFPGGGVVSFSHLDSEADLINKQGSQICLIGFDELTHFSERQFFFMMSRNRSLCGVRPCIRGTVNPDADSWLVTGPGGWGTGFISWWIGADGFPIQERAGKIRWFVRRDGELVWADTAAELQLRFGQDQMPKSVTFIPAKLTDNQILMTADPGYLGNLQALSLVDRERFLGGNWLIRPSMGTMFRKEWFRTVEMLPQGTYSRLRYWDRAATDPKPGTDPDWTAGVLLARNERNQVFVEDVVRMRGTPSTVENTIRNTAERDGQNVPIYLEQDPGQAGVADIDHLVRALFRFTVRSVKVSTDKATRAKPASALVEQGFVSILRGGWNSTFLGELEAFPEGTHDDQVDAFSGGINAMKEPVSAKAMVVGNHESLVGL